MNGRIGPSVFIASLADAFSGLGLEEKILLAPSNRVGQAWLDQAAAGIGVVANVMIMTPPRLLAELARPAMESAGLERPTAEDRLACVAAALADLGGSGGGYFSRLTPSVSFLGMLDRTFLDIAAAGIVDGAAIARSMSPRERGGDLARLYAAYRGLLERKGWIAPDRLNRCAIESPALKNAKAPFLIFPADLAEHFSPGVAKVVAVWPEDRVRELPVDALVVAELDFFAADGDLNEAREVFRNILGAGIPLDAVEITLLGGRDSAVSLCEAALEIFADGDRPALAENLPLTFEEGLPGAFAKPVRLLSAWLDWIRGGADAPSLAELFAAGLADDAKGGGKSAPADRLAEALDALPTRRGVRALVAAIGKGEGSKDSAALTALRRLVDGPLAPLALDPGSKGVLASARSLLAEWAVVGGELDAYAAKSILEDPFIAGEVDPWPGFDAFQWLSGLTDRIRLLGQGPRPGKAHVSGLDGGHSGRPVAFVMGVNDLVIPGGDRQDPALLDVERARISPLLPLASELGGGNEAKLRRLIARKRGKVFLSHSRLDLSRDREMYAADPIHELARHSGKTIRAVAFLPGTRDMRSSAAELWLDALAAGPPRFPAREAMLNLFPGLVAGEIAAAARTSGRFTAYDGWAPEAGGIPESLSPTQLETLLANPQEYFFRWVLGIALPDRSGPPPGGWLSAADRGSLMHEVFHDFQQTLMSRGERADFALHAALLDKTLEARLRRWRDLHPPENAALYELERRDLAECARVFLHSESEFQKTAKPAYLEAAFGMEGRSAPWNGGLPATLALPSGRSVRLRGRLDRVDVSDGSGGLVIWDYKTGSPAGFSTADPFKGGKLQAALYAVALKSFFPGAEGAVSASGYFFPIPEAGGRRFLYPASALSGVVAIVDVLAGLLEEGVFPYSLKQRASRGYAPIFDAAGGAERLSAQASLKASAAAGPDILRQWLEL